MDLIFGVNTRVRISRNFIIKPLSCQSFFCHASNSKYGSVELVVAVRGEQFLPHWSFIRSLFCDESVA